MNSSYEAFNTQYMMYSYIVSKDEIEFIYDITIFGLKMLVKSGLERNQRFYLVKRRKSGGMGSKILIFRRHDLGMAPKISN